MINTTLTIFQNYYKYDQFVYKEQKYWLLNILDSL